MSDLDRLPEPWHKLHPDEYEAAVAESVGAMVGTCMGLGEDAPRITDALHKGLRAMAACAFDRGYQTNRDEDHACEAIAEAEARGYQRAIDALRSQTIIREAGRAIADMTYGARQLTDAHSYVLGRAAMRTIADYLEAAARSATPDAEPAPGVPVDTEATP